MFRPVLDLVAGYERGDWAAGEKLGRTSGIQDVKGPQRSGDAVSFAAAALGK